jgi:hypothetical protein
VLSLAQRFITWHEMTQGMSTNWNTCDLRRTVVVSLAAALGPHLANFGSHRRRDMIRTLVQRIEIGPEVIKMVFRVVLEARGSGPWSIERVRVFGEDSRGQKSPYAGEHESAVAAQRGVLNAGGESNYQTMVTARFPLVGPAGVWFVSEVHYCHIVAGVNTPGRHQ